MLVAANKQLYITLPKRQKMLLSRSIVNAVRSQNPPGRFLQKESKTNLWFDVGDQRAQEKTSQALREGAPDIRKKVAAQQQQAEKEGDGAETGDDSTGKVNQKKTIKSDPDGKKSTKKDGSCPKKATADSQKTNEQSSLVSSVKLSSK